MGDHHNHHHRRIGPVPVMVVTMCAVAMSMLSLCTSKPTNKVLDLSMARLLAFRQCLGSPSAGSICVRRKSLIRRDSDATLLPK